MTKPEKMLALDLIMHAAHELAEVAWPDIMPDEARDKLIDIQIAACAALGLPEDLPLRSGSGLDDC